METHFGPKQSKSFPQDRKVQDGDTGNHQDITPTGRVGNLHRLQGRLLPHTDTGTVPEKKIMELFMSLIGLLTATEKQVHLGRLHMRPIQWHLKSNWRIPESLEKVIPLPRSLHPDLRWWLKEDNVLTGQPLHPMQHALQIFTDTSKEGWGSHLNEFIARGTWSLPESKLHNNYLELKAVFLALQEFQIPRKTNKNRDPFWT